MSNPGTDSLSLFLRKKKLYQKILILTFVIQKWNFKASETIEAVNNFDSDEDIENDDTWDEMEEDLQPEPTKCLFCDIVESSIEKAIDHLEQEHHLTLNAVKKKFNLDQYSYIKVNWPNLSLCVFRPLRF